MFHINSEQAQLHGNTTKKQLHYKCWHTVWNLLGVVCSSMWPTINNWLLNYMNYMYTNQ